MSRNLGLLSLAASCLLALRPATAVESARIGWSDLLPADQESVAGSAKAQDTGLALQLAGKTVQLSGYLLPADREGELVYAFMLVPVRGACSHAPQPPANQIVRVVPEEPYRLSRNFEAVSVSGTIRTGIEKTQLFILDGVTTVESGYSISMAAVAPARDLPDTRRRGNPWRFLDDQERER